MAERGMASIISALERRLKDAEREARRHRPAMADPEEYAAALAAGYPDEERQRWIYEAVMRWARRPR